MSKNTAQPSYSFLSVRNNRMWTLFIASIVIFYSLTGYSQGSTLLAGLADKCLDVAGGNPNNGTPIILWPCNSGANQQWKESGFFD